jgi:hypothetical protein
VEHAIFLGHDDGINENVTCRLDDFGHVLVIDSQFLEDAAFGVPIISGTDSPEDATVQNERDGEKGNEHYYEIEKREATFLFQHFNAPLTGE